MAIISLMTHLPISYRVNISSFAKFNTVALLEPIKLPTDKSIVKGIHCCCYERSVGKKRHNFYCKKLRKKRAQKGLKVKIIEVADDMDDFRLRKDRGYIRQYFQSAHCSIGSHRSCKPGLSTSHHQIQLIQFYAL